ncbi:hypothetical protein N0V88_007168 [Collariella sp. IMI 366227]|nr:hypothetical protein N0V88_007168 [Collariella sp. IMI 366227]
MRRKTGKGGAAGGPAGAGGGGTLCAGARIGCTVPVVRDPSPIPIPMPMLAPMPMPMPMPMLIPVKPKLLLRGLLLPTVANKLALTTVVVTGGGVGVDAKPGAPPIITSNVVVAVAAVAADEALVDIDTAAAPVAAEPVMMSWSSW